MTIIPDTEKARSYTFLTDAIPYGKKDAVSMRELSHRLQKEESKLRDLVTMARIDGILLCSGNEGYYFPDNEDELQDYITKRRAYIKTARAAFEAFERANCKR